MLLSILSRLVSSSLFTIGCDFLIVLTSWSLCLPKIIEKTITMNDALWAYTLYFTRKAEVKNILVYMLITGLFR